jgi:hypothetical protein
MINFIVKYYALALELIFLALVTLDTVLTYLILSKNDGYVEKPYWQINWPVKFKLPTLMGFLIKYPAAAIAVTMLAVAALFTFLLWAEWYFEIPAFLALIPASGVFALVCWRNWKIWRA